MLDTHPDERISRIRFLGEPDSLRNSAPDPTCYPLFPTTTLPEVQSPLREASRTGLPSGVSLPYSQAPFGSSYPAFKRYYENTKTSLVHPAGFGVTCRLTVPCLCFSFSLLRSLSTGRRRPGVWSAGSPYPALLAWRRLDLPSSQGTPLCICPALRPRPVPDARSLRHPDAAPDMGKTEALGDQVHYGAQSHGVCTRCLRFVPGFPADYARLASGW